MQGQTNDPMRRVWLAIMVSFGRASDDFSDVMAAHADFCRLSVTFRTYADRLSAIPLMYDANATESPPFDMYYHLEHLHRQLHTRTGWRLR